MDREMSFNGDFAVSARPALRPGGWYLGFRCPHCGEHFAILDDPTDSGAMRLSGAATFHAVCPNCEEARDYTVADMVVFESAQGGPASTA
ncbi:MAG: hypothetical protein ACR652_02120 [Methylocystis sp.]|uniref:hypothetical protein n=1 Tax=Methylocystis sp. TaxID=1911079 RepID=UPI003DA6559D